MKIEEGKFRVAVKGSAGIKTLIAQRLGCSLSGFKKWLITHPEAYDLINEEKESIIDKAEANLIKGLQEEQQWATERVLNSINARERGWLREAGINLIGTQKNTQINVEMNIHDLLKQSEEIWNNGT